MKSEGRGVHLTVTRFGGSEGGLGLLFRLALARVCDLVWGA